MVHEQRQQHRSEVDGEGMAQPRSDRPCAKYGQADSNIQAGKPFASVPRSSHADGARAAAQEVEAGKYLTSAPTPDANRLKPANTISNAARASVGRNTLRYCALPAPAPTDQWTSMSVGACTRVVESSGVMRSRALDPKIRAAREATACCIAPINRRAGRDAAASPWALVPSSKYANQ